MSAVEKQYGLIDPKTSKKLSVSDVFNNDSDSDCGQDSKCSMKSIQRQEKGVKKQTKMEMQRALQLDPTVYQYDEIYDEMTQKKLEVEQAKVNPEKKPKYIQNLMKTAERRKKENERRLERQIQKEREAEGDMFKDKEEFITSSYKAKLEEFKKADEEERKMEYIESVMDVTKQQDLGGFYRHFYKETVPDQKPGETMQTDGKEECGESEVTDKPEEKSSEHNKQTERHYRKRHNSDSNEGEEKKTKQDSSSSSTDSDSSSDSSSTSSSSEEEKSEIKEVESKQNEPKSGPEDGEIVERSDRNKKEEEKPKIAPKNGKADVKPDLKDERSKNISKNTKPEERDRRDRNYRNSAYDRDRNRNLRRDDRSYRERDRDRERERERDRERERERRDDLRKMRERMERRSSDSRRRRSKTPERKRNKSGERSGDRSRSRRGQDKGKDVKDVKGSNMINNNNNNNASNNSSNNNNNNNEDEKKRTLEEVKREPVKETEEKKVIDAEEEEEEEAKVSIWEKRTVGAVFEAALERYRQRKAARGLCAKAWLILIVLRTYFVKVFSNIKTE